jgi:hypothetical protein
MPDTPPEHVQLTEKQHQERLRRWIISLWEPFRLEGKPQTALAMALDISKQTVGGYLDGTVAPGFECFIKLHFRQGQDPLRLLREEPKTGGAAPVLHIPTSEPTATQDHRRRQKVSRGARK